ncbi:cation:proton antiporter [Candidatus Peregrinibacteria bacterium]|nr:cation:proton antiporter [Candidatus Peregrinibacteria bacterium]
MPLLTSILLLLVTSRLLGELLNRLKQPAIVGEILAGVLLGPSVLGLIQANDHLAGIAELSMFLIVLSAGLEMEFSDVLKAFGGKGIVVALLGFGIPLVSGILLGAGFLLDPMRTFFLGLCMAITALPVAIRILGNFKLLNSEIARYSIATAILNDVAALLCLGVILDRPVNGSTLEIAVSVLKTSGKLVLFALFVFVASRLLQWGGGGTRYIERGLERLMEVFGREALFGIAILFALMFGSVSETLGSHFVIGTFFGGLLLSRDVFGTSLFSELGGAINTITAGFLSPIFFAFLGLHFSISSLRSVWFLAAVIIVAMGSKIYAGILGGRIAGLTKHQALGVGIILNGRGIMELVVANIALQKGFIGQGLFSSLVLMGVGTTIVTPLLFRRYVLPHLSTQEPESTGANTE